MTAGRWSGPAGLLMGAMALIGATALAQVSGEITVGGPANAFVAGLTAPAPMPVPLHHATSDPKSELAEPEPIFMPQPVYPRVARAARQEGRVVVCFTLDERGLVQAPAVRDSTDPVFNQPVLDAISAARFTPARVGKQTVRSTACRSFQFVLR